MKDITDWKVIKCFDIEFVGQLKFAHIFYGAESVIVITNDDSVYVCGDNDDQCLGLGHEDIVKLPTKLELLCHKQVIHIITTYCLMYALTNHGTIYIWGNNNLGIFGCDVNEVCEPTLIQSLSHIFVTDIKCNDNYGLALTMNGEVYEWGMRLKNADIINEPKLLVDLRFYTIIAISSGEKHSLALTENGEVFSWGRNKYGQCGCGSYDDHSVPIKVEGLGSNIVTKISSGYYYSMVLTENGDVFAFGRNDCGQLGDNTTEKRNIATKITNSTKFIDIHIPGYESSMSIGVSRDKCCYVWGKVGEQMFIIPTKTQFKNIEDVMQNYNESELTYKSLYFKKKFGNFSNYERLVYSFNKQRYSDLKFKIDGKYIYVQKQLLISVCKHFDAMFADNVWLESNAKEVEITQYSYPVYYSFLEYLYTDSVRIRSKHLIELYYLADSYLDKNLKQKCIEMLKKSTNVNNVFTFYSFAAKHEFDNLENYFFDYMITRMSDVIKTEAYIKSKDYSILNKFIVKHFT